jgi:hypothetical protein
VKSYALKSYSVVGEVIAVILNSAALIAFTCRGNCSGGKDIRSIEIQIYSIIEDQALCKKNVIASMKYQYKIYKNKKCIKCNLGGLNLS